MQSRRPTGGMAELPDDELDDLTETDIPSGVDSQRESGSFASGLTPQETRNLKRTGHGIAHEKTERIPDDLLERVVQSPPLAEEPTAHYDTGEFAANQSGVSLDLAEEDLEELSVSQAGYGGPQAPRPPSRPSQPAVRRPPLAALPPDNALEEIDELLGAQLGSYRILSLLGEGGMGRVYLAEHVALGRKVALKLLRPEFVVKRDAVRRFFREARAVNTIGHDNIVDISDLVQLDGGHTFIIMELLRGADLTDLLRESDGPMPLHRAMRIALQVCDALEAAHEAGVFHRDLKPDNIYIVNDRNKRDFVKLLDFGVAKLQGNQENDGLKTAVGSVIGTPAYMSPEQASGIPVDQRSDIYSLGAIMYELFTGHPVFRAKSFGEFVVKHMNDDPVPPRNLADVPKIPAALENVILRCLEKDPKKRYQNVTELRDELARATATVETVIQPMVGATGDEARAGRRKLMLLLFGLGVALVAGLAFWLASGISFDNGKQSDPAGVTALAHAPKPETPVVKVKVTLDTQPTGANVARKDKPDDSLGQTPLTLNLPKSDEPVEFLFSLEGYRTATERVIPKENTMVSSALVKDNKVRSEPLDTKNAPELKAPEPKAPEPKAPEPKAVPEPKVVANPPQKPTAKQKPATARPKKPRGRHKKPRPKKPKGGPVKPKEQIDPFAM